MRDRCQQLILWLAGAALAAPVVVTPFTVFPYITGKVIWFQLGVLTLFGLWLYFIAKRSQIILPGRGAGVYAVIFFVLAAALAVVFSLDARYSFWGTAERMDGMVNVFYYAAFFFLLVILPNRTTREKLATVLVGVGVTAAFSGWLQVFNLFPFPASSFGGRMSGALGNPGFLAGFLILPLALALMRGLSDGSRRRRTRNLIGAGFLLITIFATATRGAMLGVGLAALIGLTLAVFLPNFLKGRSQNTARWALAALVTITIITLVGAVFQFKIGPKPLQRLMSISLTDDTTRTRIASLKFAYAAFKEHPLLGWGWNLYSAAYNKHYDPALLPGSPASVWFDKAHNEVAEYATEAGLLGLTAYLFLFGAAAGTLARIFFRGEKLAALVLGGGLLAYFIHNLFLFDTPASFMAFFFVLAYAHSRYRPEGTVGLTASPWLRGGVIATGAAVILGSLWGVTGKLFVSAVTAKKATDLATADTARAIDTFIRAARLHPALEPDADRKFSELIVATHGQPGSETPAYQAALKRAAAEMVSYTTLHPYQMQHLLAAGRLLTIQGGLENDPAAFVKSEQLLTQARKLAPRRANALFEIGILRLQEGRREEALAVFEKALAIDPRDRRAQWSLGLAQILLGETETGLRQLEKAMAQGYQLNSRDILNLGRTYLKVGQYEKAIAVYQKGISLNPSGAELRAVLAVAHALKGDRENAQSAARAAFRLDPTGFGSEAETFLRLLKNDPERLKELILRE